MDQEFLDSTDVVADTAEIVRRLDRDGYVLIRGLLPPDRLADLRLEFLAVLSEEGWLRPGSPLPAGLAGSRACVSTDPAYMSLFESLFRVEAFHALQHDPHLVSLFERILGGPVLPHPRILGRVMFPTRATAMHQDYVSVRGSPQTYIAWIPLSDCPPEFGSLQIAAGSHRQGLIDTAQIRRSGLDPFRGTWVSGGFALGDVLVFHSLTIHNSLPNTTERIRLSVDYRYQRITDPINPLMLETDLGISWPEVYAGWQSSTHQYYWQKYELNLQSDNALSVGGSTSGGYAW